MLRFIFFIFVLFCTAQTQANDTEKQFYRPFTETAKQSPVTVIEKKIGNCIKQSVLIKREDAWRCEAEGRIYDPCFVDNYGNQQSALCLETPWSSKGVQITINTLPNPNHHKKLDMSRTLPWAIELTNGNQCLAIESTQTYEGLPVRYRCDAKTELIGHVQRCDTEWKILQHKESNVQIISIKKAWF